MSVRHSRLLSELFSVGIHGSPLKWFGSYLSDRKQRVVIGNQQASEVNCTRGVPQGSVLGPLLFVLYIRSLHAIIPPDVTHQEFADDMLIDFSHHDITVVENRLTSAVSSVSSWLDDIGLLLNSSKSQVLFIHPHAQSNLPQPQGRVYCHGTALVSVRTAKYLGVLIDENLSWQNHVDTMANRVRKAIHRLWRHRKSMTINTCRTFYISLVQSVLTYGSNCFFPSMSDTILCRAEKLSKSGLRAVLGVHNPFPTALLYSQLNLASLRQIYWEKVMLLVFRCLHNLCSPLLGKLFTSIRSQVDTPHRPRQSVTRGQESWRLVIPLLRGPSGRKLLSFRGSVWWNALPGDVRCIESKFDFASAIKFCFASAD